MVSTSALRFIVGIKLHRHYVVHLNIVHLNIVHLNIVHLNIGRPVSKRIKEANTTLTWVILTSTCLTFIISILSTFPMRIMEYKYANTHIAARSNAAFRMILPLCAVCFLLPIFIGCHHPTRLTYI